MITLDTSALFALLNRKDPAHTQVRGLLEIDPGPYIVPAAILAEIAYLVEDRLGQRALDAFIGDLENGALAFDCGEGDWRRIRALAKRYSDLKLGMADAGVVACAERNGGRVLTLDQRHFRVVAREGSIEPLP